MSKIFLLALFILFLAGIYKNNQAAKFNLNCRKCALLKLSNRPGLKDELKEALKKLPRTEVLSESEDLIHAVSTTKTMRFKDDLFIYFHEDDVYLQSRSRVGYYDFGVNEARLKLLSSQVQ